MAACAGVRFTKEPKRTSKKNKIIIQKQIKKKTGEEFIYIYNRVQALQNFGEVQYLDYLLQF